ncbi:hypothetical protein LK12_11090 [Novosphingobium malaysiense]|uniref:Alginate export domain-containing protein n=2 Tax=Novosphingobium malaysiense TaxID=1348853 RepID=A0A0B1ZLE2_9SPHN|nr:hypothetical protein LK12_11090 [Novosphingobium malaysiense]
MSSTALLLPLLLSQAPARSDQEQAKAPARKTGAENPAAPTSEQDLPPVMFPPGQTTAPEDVDPGVIEGRRRPGYREPLPEPVTQDNPGAVRAPPPQAFPTDEYPIPDRWRLIETLGVVKERWWDPYHQNTYKGDRPINPDKVPWLPITGDDWFFTAGLTSDTVIEPRTFPIPVGVQTTERLDSIDVFGKDASFVFSQTFIASASLVKGQTAFKPPEVEYKIALAFNYNYVNVPEKRVLFVEPSKPSHRSDHFLGVQEAFIDYHLRNVSDRYDFDSIRVGIQPFQADFRGFLFNDQQLGIRLFGNRDNNRFQYNIAAFWRLEKDTNSGLNSVVQRPRDDFLFIANLYRQDFLIPALTSQITLAYNRNREGDEIEIDDNGFPVRPALLGTLRGRDYDVFYLGYNADGHVGRVNVTASAYAALGQDRNSFFTDEKADIRAFFGAAELSYDHDWMRFRLSGLFASGDHDPYDGKETGFDAVFENPIFAGADTSYWIRQTIPFAGGGRVIGVNGRNGILNSLRSSKEQGQSNFNNPGTMLLGAGADFDLTPELRVSSNANHLWFENTATLQTLRNEGSIPNDIGWDLSMAAIWRPKATQNIVMRLSAAALLPGRGFRDLFDNYEDHRNYYSVLANVIVTY